MHTLISIYLSIEKNMNRNKHLTKLILLLTSIMIIVPVQTKGQQVLDTLTYPPFVWESEPPDGRLFDQDDQFV